MNRIRVPLAPLNEQAVMNTFVAASHARATAVRSSALASSGRLSTLDQAILAKAFRGELVPQDPDDEPAAVLLERIKAERTAQAPKKKVRR